MNFNTGLEFTCLDCGIHITHGFRCRVCETFKSDNTHDSCPKCFSKLYGQKSCWHCKYTNSKSGFRISSKNKKNKPKISTFYSNKIFKEKIKSLITKS